MAEKEINKSFAFFLILLSGITSYVIANTGIDLGTLEMQAILNMAGPPMIGVLSLGIFLIIDSFNKKIRLLTMVIMIIINLAAGVMIRSAV